MTKGRRKTMIVWVFKPHPSIRAHCSSIGATELHNAFLSIVRLHGGWSLLFVF
jgi:hypothetical protein